MARFHRRQHKLLENQRTGVKRSVLAAFALLREHGSQHAEKQPQGSRILIFQVAGFDEIKFWILILGPEAQVLAPENLKEMILLDLITIIGNNGDLAAKGQLVGVAGVVAIDQA